MGAWIAQELARYNFADSRLARRFSLLIERLSDGLGRSIPLAYSDWAATKAAYCFLDNDRVSEAKILAGHFEATCDRFAATHGPILVLHDTTEFSFTLKYPSVEAFNYPHPGPDKTKACLRCTSEFEFTAIPKTSSDIVLLKYWQMFSLVLLVEVHKGSWDFILFSRKDPASWEPG